MDTCIAIRIVYKKNGKVFVRSGAGIVADSDPEKEFEECMNKARASLKALELAQTEGILTDSFDVSKPTGSPELRSEAEQEVM